MEVTRNVILDLLPVYLMGEASPDTRALVEDYLQRDPELAARVRANASDTLHRLGAAVPPLAPELELRSMVRTRRVLVWMRWLFALGCIFASLTLSFHFSYENGRVVDAGLLLARQPLLLALCIAAAAGCWYAYFTLRRMLGPGRR